MGFVWRLNLKGPQGEQGPQGEPASTADVFLAAHPVGSLFICNSSFGNPGDTYGGTWVEQPSVGPCIWLRTR